MKNKDVLDTGGGEGEVEGMTTSLAIDSTRDGHDRSFSPTPRVARNTFWVSVLRRCASVHAVAFDVAPGSAAAPNGWPGGLCAACLHLKETPGLPPTNKGLSAFLPNEVWIWAVARSALCGREEAAGRERAAQTGVRILGPEPPKPPLSIPAPRSTRPLWPSPPRAFQGWWVCRQTAQGGKKKT